MRVKVLYILAILVFIPRLSSLASYTTGTYTVKDTVKISRDSLFKIIEYKDSLLFQYSLDSMAMSELIELIWWEKDSLELVLQDLKFTVSRDSLFKVKRDSMSREMNRFHRWALRDSIYYIEQDSVRWNLRLLVDAVYGDKVLHADPDKVRLLWENLVYHLRNDSTYFWIYHADQDSIQVVLKENEELNAAIFLTNQKADSAKVYLRGDGKHQLYMHLDESVFLKHVLKRKQPPKSVHSPAMTISDLKIPRRKMPPGMPKYWTTDGVVVFQLNQIANSNWIKGGDNRLTFLWDSRGSAKYHKDKVSWNSDYWYRFGVIKSEGQSLYKNIDLMKINTNYTHIAFKKLSYSANATFDGQLFRGYRSPGDSVIINKFMAPAKVILGLGMQYKASQDLVINLSPVSGQFTFVLDTITVDQSKYGLKAGQRIKGEPGATLTVGYKKLLWKNINMNTTLRLFSNYINKPQNVDVDWTTNFSLAVNKYVSTSVFFHIIYDDDIIIPFYEWVDGVKTKVGEGKRVQFQETFGVTFTYHL